jgi:hypothetical protein
MKRPIALDEDIRTPLTFSEASDEEIVASGGAFNTKPQPMLSSGLACPARIPRSAPPPDRGMSAYDAMDLDPKSATETPRGSSADLSPSLVSRMPVAHSFLCWSITHGRIIRRLKEAMIRSRRRFWCLRSRASGRMRGGLGQTKRLYGKRLEDAANRVSDLRTRLQRYELMAAALLDSLQKSQETSPVDRKHHRYE